MLKGQICPTDIDRGEDGMHQKATLAGTATRRIQICKGEEVEHYLSKGDPYFDSGPAEIEF